MSDISRFAIRSVVADLPHTGLQELDFGDEDQDKSTVTILIGRNGSGKSTLLRELSTALRGRENVATSGVERYLRLRSITFNADGFSYQRDLFFSSGTPSNVKQNLFDKELPAPRRVIALSFTPFDKFPVKDDVHYEPLGAAERRKVYESINPEYVYLGFKAGARIHSPTWRLLNSIDALAVQEASPRLDERVAGALNAIGYKPTIRLGYRMSRKLRNDFMHGLDGRVSAARREVLEKYDYNRLLEMELRTSGIFYSFDFGTGEHQSHSGLTYDQIRELVRENILFVDSVLLTSVTTGKSIELLELSSGELNLLSGFIGLAAYLKDGCLVLIDEPENSLHPEWQLRYVAMMDAVLQRHHGCHFVIATHSPLIVSGVADRGATVLRLDQNPATIDSKAVADESPDATLVNVFDVVTPGNSYIRQIVLEAMTLIETGEANGGRASALSRLLANVYDGLAHDDPIRPLAHAVIQTIAKSNTRAN